ncbi:MAG TPA: ABC transporter substrate-binding protein [Blastocatellia bacterium]|nr:ABC transporter substrate-binding protein [Blastocatellia bacterium]HMY75629.1 ABC transporter substrate-binding protein [Blastocatellia bacterium]HMZ19910.1 ABC transporter substrate-binding protein [Blastocatellia bacterium]HNG31233.1 ABC transporter substrate-binding protein [Blastocatellia bacterium]
MALLFARRMAAALDHFSTLPDQNRKRNFGRRLLLIALVLPFGLSGCRRTSLSTKPETSVTAEAGFPRSLRDGSGDEVTLKTRPRRIVSQTLGTDEILWAICPRERIAGITKIGLAPKYCPIADELRAAGITPIASAEEILQLQPDLIFVASYSRAEIVESLQASGATIFRVANFDAIEDIQQNIRLIAQAIGEEARGDALVAQMNSELAAVRARIPVQSAPPRVLLFSLSGNTAGAKTSFDAIVRAAGAVNVVAEKGMTGFPQISAEQIVEWQPDVIVIGAEAAKASDATARLYEHPVVATTAAARNRRIIALDNRYLLSVSQHITHAIAELAAKLYGETTQTKAAAK